MKVVFISDTHNRAGLEVPDGDVLIHCGDGTSGGTLDEVAELNDWFKTLPHRYKLFIPGNHDFAFEHRTAAAVGLMTAVDVLIHESFTILEPGGKRLKVFGSPWTPWFHDWAFNIPRGNETAARDLWERIPEGVDIIVTHGPPLGILDTVARGGQSVGCRQLANRITELRPRVHAFGHIHEAYGRLEKDGTTYLNCAMLDLAYKPANPAHVLEL